MAQAPRPGVSTREDQLEADQTVMTIRINRPIFHGDRQVAESHTIAPGNVPMRERIICRKATGLPLAAFWAEDLIDIDSLMVLWWLARRLNGEATLTFDQAAEQWPGDLSADELDVTMGEPDAEADDPEA
jgi:hypothetical protein